MKDVINDILQIEEKANRILEEGRAEAAQLEKKLKEDIEKREKEIDGMVKAKLRQLDEEEKRAARESMERINRTADKRLEAMDALYEEKREEWINAIYDMIIGSDASES